MNLIAIGITKGQTDLISCKLDWWAACLYDHYERTGPPNFLRNKTWNFKNKKLKKKMNKFIPGWNWNFGIWEHEGVKLLTELVRRWIWKLSEGENKHFSSFLQSISIIWSLLSNFGTWLYIHFLYFHYMRKKIIHSKGQMYIIVVMLNSFLFDLSNDYEKADLCLRNRNPRKSLENIHSIIFVFRVKNINSIWKLFFIIIFWTKNIENTVDNNFFSSILTIFSNNIF